VALLPPPSVSDTQQPRSQVRALIRDFSGMFLQQMFFGAVMHNTQREIYLCSWELIASNGNVHAVRAAAAIALSGKTAESNYTAFVRGGILSRSMRRE
jgi:hypothetical protein